MPIVVGIRFKKAGKIYYFDPDGMDFSRGNLAIVETVRGIEYGEIVVPPKEVPEEAVVNPLKKVLRSATDEDLRQIEEIKAKEIDAFQTGLKKIAEHGLPMKLVDVEFTFDANKIIFYFTADGRVDFRELVKDLAGIFKTRIELRQIGVRDEAKMIGGVGSCGRILCCASFLGDFEPVSIRMAKDQNLSLNPTKISGICGRLMCCLKFEDKVYEDAREHRATHSGETTTAPACGNDCQCSCCAGKTALTAAAMDGQDQGAVIEVSQAVPVSFPDEPLETPTVGKSTGSGPNSRIQPQHQAEARSKFKPWLRNKPQPEKKAGVKPSKNGGPNGIQSPKAQENSPAKGDDSQGRTWGHKKDRRRKYNQDNQGPDQQEGGPT